MPQAIKQVFLQRFLRLLLVGSIVMAGCGNPVSINLRQNSDRTSKPEEPSEQPRPSPGPEPDPPEGPPENRVQAHIFCRARGQAVLHFSAQAGPWTHQKRLSLNGSVQGRIQNPVAGWSSGLKAGVLLRDGQAIYSATLDLSYRRGELIQQTKFSRRPQKTWLRQLGRPSKYYAYVTRKTVLVPSRKTSTYTIRDAATAAIIHSSNIEIEKAFNPRRLQGLEKNLMAFDKVVGKQLGQVVYAWNHKKQSLEKLFSTLDFQQKADHIEIRRWNEHYLWLAVRPGPSVYVNVYSLKEDKLWRQRIEPAQGFRFYPGWTLLKNKKQPRLVLAEEAEGDKPQGRFVFFKLNTAKKELKKTGVKPYPQKALQQTKRSSGFQMQGFRGEALPGALLVNLRTAPGDFLFRLNDKESAFRRLTQFECAQSTAVKVQNQ